jgi:alkylation response protein AidB-like acyl-CoA dehydrogenase
MNRTVSRPEVVSQEAPRFILAPNADRIRSDDEALDVARQLAAEFAKDAAERDRERRLPAKELDRFSGSGLWAITWPRPMAGRGFPSPRSPRSLRSFRLRIRILVSCRRIIWRRSARSG